MPHGNGYALIGEERNGIFQRQPFLPHFILSSDFIQSLFGALVCRLGKHLLEGVSRNHHNIVFHTQIQKQSVYLLSERFRGFAPQNRQASCTVALE